MTASLTHSVSLKDEELKKKDSEKAVLDAKVKGLESQVTEMRTSAGRVRQDHETEIAAKSKLISQLSIDLFESQKANIFMVGSPYPMGLDKVKLGDPIEKIAEAYPYQNTSKSSENISLELPSDVFIDIAFSHSYGKTKGKVEGITFGVGRFRTTLRKRPPLPDGWVETSLKRALGEPTTTIGIDAKCLVWALHDKEKTLVFHMKGDSDYIVSQAIAPGGCFLTEEQEEEIDRKYK